jgi:hypothetical protein
MAVIDTGRETAEYKFDGLNTRKDEFEKLVFLMVPVNFNNKDATYKSVIHIEPYENGVRCVTTDGRRVHVTGFKKKIAPGNYHVFIREDGISLLKTAGNLYFPNWKRILKHKITNNHNLDLSQFILKDEEYMEQLCIRSTLVIQDKKKNDDFILFYDDVLLKKKWEVFSIKNRYEIVLYLTEDRNNTFSIIMPVINKQQEMRL